jgi:hypothetical protein
MFLIFFWSRGCAFFLLLWCGHVFSFCVWLCESIISRLDLDITLLQRVDEIDTFLILIYYMY